MITPIIPFINTSSGGGDVGKGTFWFAMIMYGMVFLFGAFVMTETFGHGCVSKHVFISKAKDYVIPKPYSLQYIKSKNVYIIAKQDSYSVEYMDYEYLGGFNFWSDIQEATTFTDSALCKGAIKKYIDATTTIQP